MLPPSITSLVLGSAFALIGLACASPPPLAESATLEGSAALTSTSYTLGPGDRVSIGVFGHVENSTPATGVLVDPGGRISLPLIGTIEVLGHRLEEAEARIETLLSEFVREPDVTVSLIEQASRAFFLLGEVRNGGPFPLDRPLTALQALSYGRGLNVGADRDEVALLRRTGSTELVVHVFSAATPGPSGMIQVLPDDIIFVRQSGVGAFREQLLPYLTGYSAPVRALAQLAVASDRLSN